MPEVVNDVRCVLRVLRSMLYMLFCMLPCMLLCILETVEGELRWLSHEFYETKSLVNF